MYSDEQRKKAIELYLKYGRKASMVIQELGYPNRLTLRKWFYELRDNGGSFKPKGRKPGRHPFSEEQMRAAVQSYTEHGKSLLHTCRTLGYPHNPHTLDGWIKKYAPSEKQVFNCGHEPISYAQKVKEAAVYDFCVRGGAAGEVARNHGVRRSALYFWKNQMLGEDYDMKKSLGHPTMLGA